MKKILLMLTGLALCFSLNAAGVAQTCNKAAQCCKTNVECKNVECAKTECKNVDCKNTECAKNNCVKTECKNVNCKK